MSDQWSGGRALSTDDFRQQLLLKTEAELEEIRLRCVESIQRDDPLRGVTYSHVVHSDYVVYLCCVEEALSIARAAKERLVKEQQRQGGTP